MPIEVKGKTFHDHDDAVRWLKLNHPEIKNPDAYVATI